MTGHILRKIVLLIVLLPACYQVALAQGEILNAGTIAPALKKSANAVIRNASLKVEIKDENEIWVTHRQAITILKEQGKDLGGIRIYYRKREPVKGLSAAIYNADGLLAHKYKASEFEDLSAVQDISLFEDTRVKWLMPEGNRYPYTIVYEYQQKEKQSFLLPDWMPLQAPHVSIEKSSYELIAPESFKIRFKAMNLSASHQDFSAKGDHHYLWEVTDMPAIKTEPYSPPYQNFIPVLLATPVQFSYYGMKGTFHNWQEYGQWVYEHLLQGRDELPEQTVSQVSQMIKDIPTTKEKIKKLYQYMQSKCRYVSVQIGIGGFQPMRASEVDRLGYGDCKGLVNYMLALLKAADIPSYYTEVKSGDDKQSYLKDFASAGQGDHVILCVPVRSDTIWLECTNKYMPFGFLGDFTDDRNVLLCSEKGGFIVRTPAYADSLNYRQCTARLTLDSNNTLSGQITTALEGLQYSDRAFLNYLQDKDAEKILKRIYSFPNITISHYAIRRTRASFPTAKEQFDMESLRYATTDDERLYLPLNNINRLEDLPAAVYHRTQDVYIAHGFSQADTLVYNIPAYYTPGWIPPAVNIKNPFGEYTSDCIVKGSQITYRRTFYLKAGLYPKESYDKLLHFMKQIYAADREKVIFRKSSLLSHK